MVKTRLWCKRHKKWHTMHASLACGFDISSWARVHEPENGWADYATLERAYIDAHKV